MIRKHGLVIGFVAAVALCFAILIFRGPGESTKPRSTITHNGRTTVCETSGADVMICTSSTYVTRGNR